MNAIPSDLGVGPGGALGPSSRKDVANTSGPTNGRSFRPTPDGVGRERPGSRFVGSQFAMMVDCWVLDARPAQGRVGEFSRHIAFPLEIHLLLSDEASGRTDTPGIGLAIFARIPMRRGVPVVPRRKVRTTVRPTCAIRDLGLAPARTGELARFASCSEPFRGKGVRSA